jgi:hypothetical protein
MTRRFTPDDMELVRRQLDDHDGGVARHKDLQRRLGVLRAKCAEQPDDAVRFEAVFELVDEDH